MVLLFLIIIVKEFSVFVKIKLNLGFVVIEGC